MTDIEPNQVYTTKESQDFLKISERTMKRWLKSGIIRANKVGGRYRILGRELLRLVSPDAEKKGATLFYNTRIKKPYDRDWITEKFRNCLAEAGLKGRYSHQNFRDSVETIGHERGFQIQNSVNAVMGHTPEGEGRKYIDPESYPKISEAICQAVEEYYFGGNCGD